MLFNLLLNVASILTLFLIFSSCARIKSCTIANFAGFHLQANECVRRCHDWG